MYGQTVSGKNWYEELHEFLITKGFIASPNCPSMYTRRNEDGSLMKLLNYIDDMLYFCSNDKELENFESELSQRFRLELKGQVFWYLSVIIQQDRDFNISVDHQY